MEDYHFGAFTFSQEYWINNKKVFIKPKNVHIEVVNSGDFYWLFADEKGKEVRTLHQGKAGGGWTSVNLFSLGLSDNYSIGFRNNSPGERQFKQGDIDF
jgi:hypothetical protein